VPDATTAPPAQQDHSLSCPECEYGLTGLPDGPCPECGTAFTRAELERARAKQGFVSRLGLTGPLALGALFLPPVGTVVLLWYASTIATFVREEGWAGAAMYAAGFAVLAGLALLPTYAQCAVAGFAFGVAVGLPVSLLGFAGGAVIGYEIARRASKDRVMKLLDERPKWRAVRDALVGHWDEPPSFWRTAGVVALLRLPPNSPFALTNLVMASVKVPRGAFIAGTAVGMLPRSALAVVVGAGLNEVTRDSLDRALPAWAWYVGIGVTLVIVMVIMHMANRAVERFTKAAAARRAVVEAAGEERGER
jgi:uncharacterized membrane protein YdjX (TVP38/TMEM64 family)